MEGAGAELVVGVVDMADRTGMVGEIDVIEVVADDDGVAGRVAETDVEVGIEWRRAKGVASGLVVTLAGGMVALMGTIASLVSTGSGVDLDLVSGPDHFW